MVNAHAAGLPHFVIVKFANVTAKSVRIINKTMKWRRRNKKKR